MVHGRHRQVHARATPGVRSEPTGRGRAPRRVSNARLTVAVPLHRSARWVSGVAENLRSLPADVHVLLSDATHDDDALAQLQTLFRDDHRVCVLRAAAPSEKGWRAHYNHLLEQADTELFAWLPH